MTLSIALPLDEALLALAFIGDLSMGQPTDHSRRVAWLTVEMATALRQAGMPVDDLDCVRQVSLLRFVGCTANAAEVATVMSNDVQGRAALLSGRMDAIEFLVSPQVAQSHHASIIATHCEVSGLIAQTLGLGELAIRALTLIHSHWEKDASDQLARTDQVPQSVYLARLAGDLDIVNREHGLSAAAAWIAARADHAYPGTIVHVLSPHFGRWANALKAGVHETYEHSPRARAHMVPLTLVADAIDLKLPWLAGFSRAVADLAMRLATAMDTGAEVTRRVVCAGLLHGLGRVNVENAVWNRTAALTKADWEKVRLTPYWTSRAAGWVPSLEKEVQIAAHAYERLDGSGFFRALGGSALTIEHRILQVATSFCALTADRPWRAAMSRVNALACLQAECAQGRLDARVCHVLSQLTTCASKPQRSTHRHTTLLSPRELQVLQLICRGHTNKEAARLLALSPSTVRTHTESIFRKLACSSRSAVTFKASQLGLLEGTL